jgi:hypothetical protein
MKNKGLKYKSNELPEHDELAPQLSKLKTTNPFRVPDNYFEKLPEEILLKVNKSEKIPVTKKLISIMQQPKFTIAAAVAVLFIVSSILLFHKPASIFSAELADLTLEDILQENPDLIETFDETLLLETLVAITNEGLVNFLDTTSVINQGICDDELIEYLSEENLTPDILYDF